jgi:hypothetical protein
MKSKIIHNILVILIILLSAISYSGCKKQAKCGCGKDVVFSYDSAFFNYSDITFSENGATGSFQQYNGIYYDTYYFCNPKEWYAIYDSIQDIEQILISGDVFWDCSYVNSQSYSYNSYYKVYNIQVTQMIPYLYGKK